MVNSLRGARISHRVSPDSFSIGDVRHAQQGEARVKAEPEHDVAHQSVLFKHWRARDDDKRDLDELHEEQVEPIRNFNSSNHDSTLMNHLPEFPCNDDHH
jgi:hypothetical protein